MNLTVNGVERTISSPPLTPLLQVLREELGITSPKAGCQQGGCGSCTVLVGGEPRRACLLPVAAVEGASITTVEGLGTPERMAAVQQAFHDHYASQCGFCTPGMMIAVEALTRREASPDRYDIEEALAGHFCRCTGYVKIIAAAEALARGEVHASTNDPLAGGQSDQPEILVPGSPA
ncbi:MAG TPA: (2Fe-2S)-binding protein [Gaiellaceae bacterium]|nr:(2Fe-2S)-binding protein [Gaiellaceae bacterium]